jgi:hypothetical protein
MNCIFPITKTPFHWGQMVFLTLGENIADFQFGFVLLVSDVFVLPITLCIVLSSLIPSRCHTQLLCVLSYPLLFLHVVIPNYSVCCPILSYSFTLSYPITLCVVLSSPIPSRCHTRLLYVNLFFLTSVLFDHTDIANFSVIAHYPVVPGHFHCHIWALCHTRLLCLNSPSLCLTESFLSVRSQ